jgi:hypothetical protein
VPSLFTRFSIIGRLPKPLRAQLEPEGIIFVAEKVGVRQCFSGSVPGRHDAAGANRHIGLVVFTRQRLYAWLPTLQRLNQPANRPAVGCTAGRPGEGRDLRVRRAPHH